MTAGDIWQCASREGWSSLIMTFDLRSFAARLRKAPEAVRIVLARVRRTRTHISRTIWLWLSLRVQMTCADSPRFYSGGTNTNETLRENPVDIPRAIHLSLSARPPSEAEFSGHEKCAWRSRHAGMMHPFGFSTVIHPAAKSKTKQTKNALEAGQVPATRLWCVCSAAKNITLSSRRGESTGVMGCLTFT